jgi:hypothetical protein
VYPDTVAQDNRVRTNDRKKERQAIAEARGRVEASVGLVVEERNEEKSSLCARKSREKVGRPFLMKIIS